MSDPTSRVAPDPGSRPHPLARRRARLLVAACAAGGLLLAPEVLPASAAPATTAAPTVSGAARLAPPAGMAWIQGVVTDQAGHPLDNVNVEVWGTDTALPTEPVASNLSYAGTPADQQHQRGVFRIEVPGGTAYRLTFSTVGGREDADLYRMRAPRGGAPLMTRAAAGAASTATAGALALAPGRVLDLGKVQLARHGQVASKVKVTVAGKGGKGGKGGKVRVAQKPGAGAVTALRVRVRSKYVSNPTGQLRIRIGKKTVKKHLARSAGGRMRVRLPDLDPGRHRIRVKYRGSDTVAASTSKPVRVVVTH